MFKKPGPHKSDSRIKDLRLKLGLLQSQAAYLFGVSAATMNRFEQSDGELTLEPYKFQMAEVIIEVLKSDKNINKAKLKELLIAYRIEIVYIILMNERVIPVEPLSDIDPNGYLKFSLQSPGSLLSYEYTQLLTAAQRGDCDFCDKIIEGGVNPNPPDQKPKPTPLHYLLYHDTDNSLQTEDILRREQTATRLVEAGADVNARDDAGQDPLTLACGAGFSVEFIDLLISKGADVNYNNPSFHQISPLIYSIMCGRDDLAKRLIEQNADINLPNADGNTAMHAAVEYERLDIFKYMVKAGGDARLKNRTEDLSAEDMIGTKNLTEFREVLEEYKKRKSR